MDQFYISSNIPNFELPPIPDASLYNAVYTSAAPSLPLGYASHPYPGRRQEMLAYQFASYSQQATTPSRTPSTLQTAPQISHNSYKSSKDVPLDVIARRRAQNRASQRAYRNRKDSHIRSLETRLSEMKGHYEKLMAEHEQCRTDHEKLRKKLEFGIFENVQLKDSRRSQSLRSSTGPGSHTSTPSQDGSLDEEFSESDGQV